MALLGKQHSGLPPWPCYFIRLLQLGTSIIVIYVIVWLHENIAKTDTESVGREVIRKLETMWGWQTVADNLLNNSRTQLTGTRSLVHP